MEELFIFFAICLMGGSAFLWWSYPIVTTIFVAGVLGTSWVWVQKKRKEIAYQEKESNRLAKVRSFPEIHNVYIPCFDQKVRNDIKILKKQLNKKGMTEVLKVLTSLEEMVEERIIPRMETLSETLDNYIYTNHLVIDDKIKINEEKLSNTPDEGMRKVLQNTIANLKEQKSVLAQSRDEIIYFYSHLNNIFLQIENMRLKSSKLNDPERLLLDVKHDLNETFNDFSEANSLLDEISKI